MSATVQNSSDKLEPSTGISDASLSLEPTMDHVIRDCPRFRILIVGKSGVGKSSLINEIFKAKLATVTDYTRGPASIEEEITSEHNDRFVLHDSRGFEAGEADHFNIVKKFIEERSESDDIHKKLHAIWLCIATPIAGGRILERGDDKLLELKLKSVPIIVVFTKYDELVTRMDIELQGSTLDAEKRSRKARKQAARLYKDDCVRPLREAIKNNTPPIVNVAVASGYEQSVENLIQATVKAMYKRTKSARSSRLRSMMFWSSSQTTGIGMDPQGFVKIMTATAQRIALGPKILASIEVGRKKLYRPVASHTPIRYWRGLASSIHFQDKPLKSCLHVIHSDIVVVWNMPDIEPYLLHFEFMAEVSRIVEDLADEGLKSPNKGVRDVCPQVGSVIPVHPAIGIPLAATCIFASWAYSIYKQTPGTVRCLMAYIVDLTIIMQRLFWLSRPSDRPPLTSDIANQVLQKYKRSMQRYDVHNKVRSFMDRTAIIKLTKKDYVFDEVVKLIETHRFPDEEASRFQEVRSE